MTDVTQQLADALREAEDALAWCYDVQLAPGEKTSPQHKALAKVRAALTAFEASRAGPAEDVVERVARAIGARHEAGYVVGSLYSENMRELARAALSALPAPAEDVVERVAKAMYEESNEYLSWEQVKHSGEGRTYNYFKSLARAAIAAMPRDEELEGLRELSERATKGKAWHAIEGHVFSCIVDEHGVAEKHIAATSPSDATLIAAAVNYVRNKLAAPDFWS